jgi:hypothetical protein
VSHLRFDRLVYRERDSFDPGRAVYDEVPGLGWRTSLVDARLVPDPGARKIRVRLDRGRGPGRPWHRPVG